MSHIRKNKDKHYTPAQKKQLLEQPRWSYAKDQVDHQTLEENFDFLNSGVVIRGNAEGIPLMTTTGIFGPIGIHDTVKIHRNAKQTVTVVSTKPVKDKKNHLLNQLKQLKANAKEPSKDVSVIVAAKWISATEGGQIPGLGGSANVFGSTGSLLINEPEIQFPLIDIHHPKYHETLAYYGAKLLKPDEEFYMGYNLPIFGMEYDTSLPGYIQDYVMKPYGGGGMFVEHHPFPHIWFPNPRDGEQSTNICRVLLGRIIPHGKQEKEEQKKDYLSDGKTCLMPEGDKKDPKYHFTVFEVPQNGSALAVDECTIHNDSFCNGKQVVFLADTHADTVALRETSPFKNVSVNYQDPPLKKKK